MGRVQLSTAFGIDGPRRTTNAKYPDPPLYTDAPFDLDSDVDAPDTVYEAFLTREEMAARGNAITVVGNNSAVIPSAAAAQAARETAPSPIESDESSSVTPTTSPPTRIPSPVRENRRDAPSPNQASTPMYLAAAPTGQVVEEAASESDSDFSLESVSDDLAMSDIGADSRSPSPGSWSGRSAQPSPTLQPSSTTAATPSTLTVNPALVPTAPSARTQILDVDTDDDAHSTSSSSAAASSTSGPRYSTQSGIRNFTPRVFRARDAVVRPQVIMDEVPGASFHPVHQQRVLAPMR
ncbi:hypothetical protein FS837_010747 [Tulasnella sp. UAMH 9824]|nr:hypothetical protein FS837_010747 [Tulasnella sp. UAMH 9824]